MSTARRLTSRAAALERWAGVPSAAARREQLAPARAGRRAKWARQADPDGVLSEAELAEAVDRLQRAHCLRAAAASAAARAARRQESEERSRAAARDARPPCGGPVPVPTPGPTERGRAGPASGIPPAPSDRNLTEGTDQ